MSISNTSNTSNTSLAHAGQVSSPLLSRTFLDPAGEVIVQFDPNRLGTNLDATRPRALHEMYLALDASHRQALWVQDLLTDLSVTALSTKAIAEPDLAFADNLTTYLKKAGIEMRHDKLGRIRIAGKQLMLPTVFACNDFWAGQIASVIASASERRVRVDEIVLQQGDILSYLAQSTRIGPLTHPWTMGYLAAVNMFVYQVGAQIKALYDYARPIELAPEIMPIIQTPAHSAYPSGHAMEAHALAVVITALYGEEAGAYVTQIAERIALNRVIAGVHYRVDNVAGAAIGAMLGHYAVARLTGEEVALTLPAIIDSDLGTHCLQNFTFWPDETTPLRWLKSMIDAEPKPRRC